MTGTYQLMKYELEGIEFHPDRALALYLSGQQDALSQYLLNTLDAIKAKQWTAMTPQRRSFVNDFLNHFGYLFTQEDYRISNEHAVQFILRNGLISNLVAISAFKTTDSWLALLLSQENNVLKSLALYNARCATRYDPALLFKTAGDYASLWYGAYFEVFAGGTPTERLWENARRHVAHIDPRWSYVGQVTGSFYFISSYFALDMEREIKRFFHRQIGSKVAATKLVNRPNPKSIAIVSARWQRSSTVYRSLAPFVEALRPDYELTLVRLGRRPSTNFDHSWFKAVKNINLKEGRCFDLEEIRENDFALAYFPDVGMEPEEKYLCNLRLAPIQVMGYGHPVSTHGSQIDYFVGGRDVELLGDAKTNYSERLVAIPGLGAFPVLPKTIPPKSDPQDQNPLLINCAWIAHKCTYPHLTTLRKIAERSKRPIRFRFFVSLGILDKCHAPALQKEMEEVIGAEAVEIVHHVPYAEFQRILGQGAFAIDSFPFGGYNSIVDCFVLGQPVVALEGHHAVNRLCAALLRRVGLEHLIAHDPDEFIDLSLQLIEDNSYRERISSHLRGLDLEERLCRTDELAGFKRAIGYLIENHATLAAQGSREPIVIE